MSAHTPGPWEASPHDLDMYIFSANPEGSEIRIAEMYAGSVADAQLIAAAPDLLEALEEARRGLQWYRATYSEDVQDCDYEVMDQIDAAIAKATGETE